MPNRPRLLYLAGLVAALLVVYFVFVAPEAGASPGKDRPDPPVVTQEAEMFRAEIAHAAVGPGGREAGGAACPRRGHRLQSRPRGPGRSTRVRGGGGQRGGGLGDGGRRDRPPPGPGTGAAMSVSTGPAAHVLEGTPAGRSGIGARSERWS